MRINISKKDIIWNYAGTIFSMGINYMLLPFFLHYFNDATLSLWYIFMNLANLATLFIFGFSPSFARSIAYCWSGADRIEKYGGKSVKTCPNAINEGFFILLLQTCRLVYLVVSLIAFFVFLTIGTGYVFYVTKDQYIEKWLWPSWIIMIMAICLNLYFGYYMSLLSGIGKVAERNKAQVYSSILRIALTFILLFLKFSILGASIAYFLYGIVLRSICKYYFYYAAPFARNAGFTRWNSELKSAFDNIWPNSWRDGMVSISDYLCTQAGVLVASLFIPLESMSMYSLSVQLVTAIAKISRSYQIAQIPVLQSSYITGDKETAKKAHSKSILAFCFVFIVGMIGLILVGIPFVRLFRNSIHISVIMVLSIGISQFLIVLRNCYASFLSTTNRVDYWLSFIISGVSAIVLSVVLLKSFGSNIYYIILASIICELSYNAWHWARQVHTELSMGFIEMFKIGTKSFIKDFGAN